VRQIYKIKESDVLFNVGFSVRFISFPPKSPNMRSNFAVAVGSEVVTLTLTLEPDEVSIFVLNEVY
jgi:hypothetical protein